VRSLVRLPKLGETADDVVIQQWLVRVGDSVEAGQPLVSVETDKVTTEVPAPVSGIIAEILVQPDDEVRTGDHICVITD
jgi:pyruvate/2-oxoglutarate dehydrogenase complex dihydrolipoamide acyltransferase (E2) component